MENFNKTHNPSDDNEPIKNSTEDGYDLQRVARESLPRIEHDFLHIDGQDKELLRQWFDYLQRTLDNPENYLDHGGAAVVFTINDTICIKMITNRHDSDNAQIFNLGNTAEQEMRFQEKVATISIAGVRCPKPILYLHGKNYHGIVMEKLNAVNLQKCFNGDERFPNSFDPEEFGFDLEEYVYTLHDEHNISHGDLYARNVMVDTESGKPIIIDFGRTKHQSEHLKKDDKIRLEEILNKLKTLTK